MLLQWPLKDDSGILGSGLNGRQKLLKMSLLLRLLVRKLARKPFVAGLPVSSPFPMREEEGNYISGGNFDATIIFVNFLHLWKSIHFHVHVNFLNAVYDMN